MKNDTTTKVADEATRPSETPNNLVQFTPRTPRGSSLARAWLSTANVSPRTAAVGRALAAHARVAPHPVTWRHIRRGDVEAHVSAETLAGEMGVSPRTVKRGLADLEAAGLEKRRTARTNTYVFPPAAGAAVPPAVTPRVTLPVTPKEPRGEPRPEPRGEQTGARSDTDRLVHEALLKGAIRPAEADALRATVEGWTPNQRTYSLGVLNRVRLGEQAPRWKRPAPKPDQVDLNALQQPDLLPANLPDVFTAAREEEKGR